MVSLAVMVEQQVWREDSGCHVDPVSWGIPYGYAQRQLDIGLAAQERDAGWQ